MIVLVFDRIGKNPQSLLELTRTDKIAKLLDLSNDHQENKIILYTPASSLSFPSFTIICSDS